MEFISVFQASKKLKVSNETIYNMLKDGRLGGKYTKGKGKKRGSWSVSIESIKLLEENSIIKSVYQIQEKNIYRGG